MAIVIVATSVEVTVARSQSQVDFNCSHRQHYNSMHLPGHIKSGFSIYLNSNCNLIQWSEIAMTLSSLPRIVTKLWRCDRTENHAQYPRRRNRTALQIHSCFLTDALIVDKDSPETTNCENKLDFPLRISSSLCSHGASAVCPLKTFFFFFFFFLWISQLMTS
jgi:hypothetical protein